jgi:hypothetical protein
MYFHSHDDRPKDLVRRGGGDRLLGASGTGRIVTWPTDDCLEDAEQLPRLDRQLLLVRRGSCRSHLRYRSRSVNRVGRQHPCRSHHRRLSRECGLEASRSRGQHDELDVRVIAETGVCRLSYWDVFCSMSNTRSFTFSNPRLTFWLVAIRLASASLQRPVESVQTLVHEAKFGSTFLFQRVKSFQLL